MLREMFEGGIVHPPASTSSIYHWKIVTNPGFRASQQRRCWRIKQYICSMRACSSSTKWPCRCNRRHVCAIAAIHWVPVEIIAYASRAASQ